MSHQNLLLGRRCALLIESSLPGWDTEVAWLLAFSPKIVVHEKPLNEIGPVCSKLFQGFAEVSGPLANRSSEERYAHLTPQDARRLVLLGALLLDSDFDGVGLGLGWFWLAEAHDQKAGNETDPPTEPGDVLEGRVWAQYIARTQLDNDDLFREMIGTAIDYLAPNLAAQPTPAQLTGVQHLENVDRSAQAAGSTEAPDVGDPAYGKLNKMGVVTAYIVGQTKKDPEKAVALTTREIASAVGVSESTVRTSPAWKGILQQREQAKDDRRHTAQYTTPADLGKASR